MPRPCHPHAPSWFVALTPIEAQPGVAQVSNGWNAVGSLEVQSQSAYAHDELWRSVTRISLLLGVVGVLASLAAAWVLRRIRRPLDNVAAQARRWWRAASRWCRNPMYRSCAASARP